MAEGSFGGGFVGRLEKRFIPGNEATIAMKDSQKNLWVRV